MDDRNNTIAGWVLAAGVAGLGLSIISSKIYHADKPERPEQMAYAIEGVDLGGEGAAAAAVPLPVLLAGADASAGANVFKKCAACHTIDPGGAHGIGPNLHAIMGKPVAGIAGFSYSDALESVGGQWTFDQMDAWLASPRSFAPGTKMTFAGLSSPEDRADILLYLNEQGSNLSLPAAPEMPAEGEGEGEDGEAANAVEGAAGDAEPAAEGEPVAGEEAEPEPGPMPAG